jgi:hypothetical protein
MATSSLLHRVLRDPGERHRLAPPPRGVQLQRHLGALPRQAPPRVTSPTRRTPRPPRALMVGAGSGGVVGGAIGSAGRRGPARHPRPRAVHRGGPDHGRPLGPGRRRDRRRRRRRAHRARRPRDRGQALREQGQGRQHPDLGPRAEPATRSRPPSASTRTATPRTSAPPARTRPRTPRARTLRARTDTVRSGVTAP